MVRPLRFLTGFATISILLFPVLAMNFDLTCPPSTFVNRYCSAKTHIAIRAYVVNNSTLTCTICDGKAIAMGLRKRVFVLRVLQVFKGPASIFQLISAKAIETFTEGISMETGKTYYVNLGPVQTVVGETPPSARPIDLCDPPPLWASLTLEQLKFLRENAELPIC